MTFLRKILMVVILVGFIGGCATQTALKAPCNWEGTDCGPQIPINQWDSSCQ